MRRPAPLAPPAGFRPGARRCASARRLRALVTTPLRSAGRHRSSSPDGRASRRCGRGPPQAAPGTHDLAGNRVRAGPPCARASAARCSHVSPPLERDRVPAVLRRNNATTSLSTRATASWHGGGRGRRRRTGPHAGLFSSGVNSSLPKRYPDRDEIRNSARRADSSRLGERAETRRSPAG